MRKAIAIDFDGCLCTNAYPEIGEPNWTVIYRAKAEQRAGAGLILWTCREGQLLLNAIAACEGWGLIFDSVNESLPDWIEEFGTRPRKIGATEYWDDKAVNLTTLNGTYANVEWFNQVNAELQVYKEAKDAGRLLILPDAKYTDSDGEEALRTAMWTCGYKNNAVTRYTADAIAEKLCRESNENRINQLCMDILSISDAEFGKAEEIVRRQREYIHPFRMATVKRLNELGEFNTKVISAMRDLRELIKSGESI